MVRRLLVIAPFALAAGSQLLGQANASRAIVFDIPVNAQFPPHLSMFRGTDGRKHLSFWAQFTNFSQTVVVAQRLELVDAGSGTVIASYDSTSLRRPELLRVDIGEPIRTITPRRMSAGRIALLRVWLDLDSAITNPRALVARITFDSTPTLRVARAQNDTDATPVTTFEAIPVRPPIVVGPPLRGGPWRASGGAGPTSYHNGFNTVGGKTRMAEHFAVDFQKVDSAGNILPNPFPDTLNNAMFYSNAAEVLAVADGVVSFVRDGFPANVPTPSGNENMPIPLTRESSAGNQLSIRIAPGVHALYAHLAPGSIRLKVGDRVRRGQVIGKVGNVGNAKNPHLHFEIADAPEINVSEGIEWEIDSFELWGHQINGRMPDIKQTPLRRTREMLLQDAIVRFP